MEEEKIIKWRSEDRRVDGEGSGRWWGKEDWVGSERDCSLHII